jgi:hypothetical protein
MALFEITTKEQSDASLWLRSINREIQSHTLTKSTFYDFNFVQGNPSGKSKRFEWDESEMEEEPTTRPTFENAIRDERDLLEFFNTPEEIEDIPKFDSKDVQL